MSLQVEPVDPGSYELAAAACIAAGVEVGFNEHGTPVSVHHCATCGQRFTVCPPSPTFGDGCLGSECGSYDPARDAEIYFAPDDPGLVKP